MASRGDESPQAGPSRHRAPSASKAQRPRAPSSPKLAPNEFALKAAALAAAAATAEEEACWICAEPVVIYAVGPCNHRMCHVCSLRLRALYKKMECTFCKTPLDHVIFTASSDKAFEAYEPDATPYRDDQLGIAFETREQLDDALALLRFNCPEPGCDILSSNWGDLRRHVKRDHQRLMCDLCTRNQKIFSQEHTLFTQSQLKGHIEQGDNASNKPSTSSATPSGFTGHPICDFCRVHYYDADELFKHCREKHEQCFICVRNGSGRQDYYVDYPALERHFSDRHFVCDHPDCRTEKFVVFETMLDLQAHQIEKHGADASKQAKRDARRIEVDFSHAQPARAPTRRPQDDTSSRRREEATSRPTFVSVTPSNLAPGRNVPGLGPSRKEPVAGPSTPRSVSPRPLDSEADRHDALLARVRAAVASENKVTAFKTAVRSYRSSETAATDLLDTFWVVFDHRMNTIDDIVTSLAELFDTPGKKADLLRAWQDFHIDQDAFPSLAPVASTMSSQPSRKTAAAMIKTSSSGSAKRVVGSAPSRNGQSNPAVWARVQAAANNSSAFPSLPPAPRTKAASTTAWSTSAQGGSTPTKPAAKPLINTPPARSLGGVTRSITSPTVTSPTVRRAAPSRADFPDLPASATLEARAAVKRSVFANGTAASPTWGAPSQGPLLLNGEIPLGPRGKKGKRKELLFTNSRI